MVRVAILVGMAVGKGGIVRVVWWMVEWCDMSCGSVHDTPCIAQ